MTTYDTPEYRAAIKASVAKYELQAEAQRRQTIKAVAATLLLTLLILALLYVIFAILIPDLSWCYENYSPTRIPHCMHYENNVYGRFIQPS